MEPSTLRMQKKVPSSSSRSKKLLLGSLTLLIAVLLTLNFLPQTQKISTQYVDDNFQRALATFAISKSLNAIISVAQGTEIAATPAGIGVNFAVGELLDPINDMVERFSWVMLMATLSLGIQKILIVVVSTPLIEYLFLLLGIATLYRLYKPKKSYLSTLVKLFVFLLILRFSMPLMALANQGVYDYFLAEDFQKAALSLQQQQIDLDKTGAVQQQSGSLWAKIKKIYQNTKEALNIKKQLRDLRLALDNTFNNLLHLMTIFVIQTILFPLLFLYLLIKLLKSSLNPSSLLQQWVSRYDVIIRQKISPHKES